MIAFTHFKHLYPILLVAIIDMKRASDLGYLLYCSADTTQASTIQNWARLLFQVITGDLLFHYLWHQISIDSYRPIRSIECSADGWSCRMGTKTLSSSCFSGCAQLGYVTWLTCLRLMIPAILICWRRGGFGISLLSSVPRGLGLPIHLPGQPGSSWQWQNSIQGPPNL